MRGWMRPCALLLAQLLLVNANEVAFVCTVHILETIHTDMACRIKKKDNSALACTAKSLGEEAWTPSSTSL